MDQAPWVMDEIEAGAILIRELSLFAPIKVAFWLKRDDEDTRHLYLSSDQFDSPNRPRAYGELLRITREKPSLFLDPLRVSLLSGEDRWTVAAKRMNDQFSDRLGTRLLSQPFGDRYIADAYIYPSPLSDTFPR